MPKSKPKSSIELLNDKAGDAALKARLVNETQVATQLAAVVKLQACTCERTHPYSGVGKRMCYRCRTLVLWETLNEGESSTKKDFEAKKV
jgi:hypothetical protein